MLGLLNRSFDEMDCTNHFYLDHISLFHVMNFTARYSFCAVVSTFSMCSAVQAFESCWPEWFWSPAAEVGDQAVNNNVFTSYLSSLDIEFKSIPPRHHNKNVLEAEHGAIRSILLRLTRDISSDLEFAALQLVRI